MIWHGFLYFINYHWPPLAEKRRFEFRESWAWSRDVEYFNRVFVFSWSSRLFSLAVVSHLSLSHFSVLPIFMCYLVGRMLLSDQIMEIVKFQAIFFIETLPSLDFQAAACPLPSRRPNEGSSEAMMLASAPSLGRPTSASDRQGTTTSSSAVVPHFSSHSLIL